MSGKIELVIGCMYSGKSTELQRRIRRFLSIKKKVMVIKHASDTRYDNGSYLSTHDRTTIPCISVNKLDFIKTKEPADLYSKLIDTDVIVIEESQFFPDLLEMIVYAADIMKKHCIIGGLNGDFQRNPFGDINLLVPHAESIHKLSALCVLCGDGTAAHFSKRITASKDQILVGSENDYIPVCRKHYL